MSSRRRSSRLAAKKEHEEYESIAPTQASGTKRATNSASPVAKKVRKTTKSVRAVARKSAVKEAAAPAAPAAAHRSFMQEDANEPDVAAKKKASPRKRAVRRAPATGVASGGAYASISDIMMELTGAPASSSTSVAREHDHVNHFARIGDVCFAIGILPHVTLADVLSLASVNHEMHSQLSNSPMLWSTLRARLLDSSHCSVHAKKLMSEMLVPTEEQLALSAKMLLRAHIQPSSVAESNACQCKLRNARNVFLDLHASHVKRHNQETTPSQRKQEIIAALGEFGESLRGDSKLCMGYIRGTLYEYKSAAECAAQMSLTGYLMSLSHIAWSQYHDQFDSALRQIKFSRNLTWKAAHDEVIDEYGPDAECYEPERDVECWNCGRYGHMSYECYDRW